MDFTILMGLAGGHAEARAIQTALKIGLFEALADGQRDAAALASAIRCDRRATMLLGNALAALGILEKAGENYRLDPQARRFVLKTSPEYLGGMILFDEGLWSTWERLDESIRTGKPARPPDMYQTLPEETARFIRGMDSLVRARGDAVWTAENLDLSSARTIVDLGGGPGTYLVEFLRRNPNLRGAIYDLKATLEVAREILAREAWALDRIEMREVDYNSGELPGPVDAIFMSNIIHSEDEGANAALFGKCFRAINSGGLIAIKDHIMDAGMTQPAAGAVFALYLLLTTRGRDYSFHEVGDWMRAAGFSEIRLHQLPSPPFTSSIVTARKP